MIQQPLGRLHRFTLGTKHVRLGDDVLFDAVNTIFQALSFLGRLGQISGEAVHLLLDIGHLDGGLLVGGLGLQLGGRRLLFLSFGSGGLGPTISGGCTRADERGRDLDTGSRSCRLGFGGNLPGHRCDWWPGLHRGQLLTILFDPFLEHGELAHHRFALLNGGVEAVLVCRMLLVKRFQLGLQCGGVGTGRRTGDGLLFILILSVDCLKVGLGLGIIAVRIVELVVQLAVLGFGFLNQAAEPSDPFRRVLPACGPDGRSHPEK